MYKKFILLYCHPTIDKVALRARIDGFNLDMAGFTTSDDYIPFT